MLNGYKGTRKIEATFYIDVNKTEVRTMTHTFVTYDNTIDECRKNLTEQINRYKDNPLMIKVTLISEYFEH